MEVKVISDTIQEFNGERFYLCGNYFQHNGKRLHIAVWESHNGDVPKGYHIHHKDKNRANNEIGNLELLKSGDHLSMHMTSADRIDYAKRHIETIRDLASVWHGSESGKAWHSKHAKETWEKRKPKTYVCTCCGKEFGSVSMYSDKGNRFCSNNCRAQYRRLSGVDDVTRICVVCGKEYRVNKYAKIKTCGTECGRILKNESKKHRACRES